MMTQCVACECIGYEDNVMKDPRSMSPMLRKIQEERNTYVSVDISEEHKASNCKNKSK